MKDYTQVLKTFSDAEITSIAKEVINDSIGMDRIISQISGKSSETVVFDSVDRYKMKNFIILELTDRLYKTNISMAEKNKTIGYFKKLFTR
jgi:hypothetical protein